MARERPIVAPLRRKTLLLTMAKRNHHRLASGLLVPSPTVWVPRRAGACDSRRWMSHRRAQCCCSSSSCSSSSSSEPSSSGSLSSSSSSSKVPCVHCPGGISYSYILTLSGITGGCAVCTALNGLAIEVLMRSGCSGCRGDIPMAACTYLGATSFVYGLTFMITADGTIAQYYMNLRGGYGPGCGLDGLGYGTIGTFSSATKACSTPLDMPCTVPGTACASSSASCHVESA